MRLHRIQVEKISSFEISVLSTTFDNYLWFSQFDMFTELYHICILYINTLFELIFF